MFLPYDKLQSVLAIFMEFCKPQLKLNFSTGYSLEDQYHYLIQHFPEFQNQLDTIIPRESYDCGIALTGNYNGYGSETNHC